MKIKHVKKENFEKSSWIKQSILLFKLTLTLHLTVRNSISPVTVILYICREWISLLVNTNDSDISDFHSSLSSLCSVLERKLPAPNDPNLLPQPISSSSSQLETVPRVGSTSKLYWLKLFWINVGESVANENQRCNLYFCAAFSHV